MTLGIERRRRAASSARRRRRSRRRACRGGRVAAAASSPNTYEELSASTVCGASGRTARSTIEGPASAPPAQSNWHPRSVDTSSPSVQPDDEGVARRQSDRRVLDRDSGYAEGALAEPLPGGRAVLRDEESIGRAHDEDDRSRARRARREDDLGRGRVPPVGGGGASTPEGQRLRRSRCRVVAPVRVAPQIRRATT